MGDIPSFQDVERERFYRRYESNSLVDVLAQKFHYHGLRISVIPKLKPLFTDELTYYEYILLEGGRGSGKSETIALKLILISRQEKTRILCTREIQNSIKDSVKKVIEDWIYFLGIADEFHITRESITHKETGTDFVFKGLKAGTDNDTMKSLKGFKYVWVEEAQTLSLESEEKLDPTIRIDGRQIYFSYNLRTQQDTVNLIKFREKAHLIKINYDENPFLPKVLYDQALAMKVLNPNKYAHIWGGQPMPEDPSSIILPYEWLSKCVDLHLKDTPGKITDLENYKSSGGFDVADGITEKHDKNALVLRSGPVITHAEEWQINEVYQSVSRINGRHKALGFSKLYYDATALGTAAKSEFARLNQEDIEINGLDGGLPYQVYAFKGGMSPYGKDKVFTGQGKNKVTNGAQFKNAKAQIWWNLRLRLENSMRLLRGEKIDRNDYYLSFSSLIPNLDSIFMELAQATYEEDNSDKIVVDKAPGVYTVQIDGKDKKRRSPNLGDGCNMAFAGDLTNGIRAHQPGVRKAEVIG